jgi:C-terminal processing protease CtpA/Prc
MRTTRLALLMTVLAVAPAAAQDTTVMIQNKDCTVKVDGKRLPAAEEKKACEQMQSKMKVMELRSKEMNEQAKVMSEQAVRLGRDMAQRTTELARIQEREMSTRMRELNTTARRSAEAGARAEEFAVIAREMPARVRELTSRAMATITARPRFGITIDTRPRDTDQIGAYVTGVTPGGPAAKAGIQSGDIIAKLAGKAVTARGEESAGLRLIEMIGELDAGKAVDVELRRGKETKKVKVTPADDDADFFTGVAREGDVRSFSFAQGEPFGVTRPGELNMLERMVPGEAITVRPSPLGTGSFSFTTTARGPLASLEMATLNAGLGSYFGTTDGVLIINAGEKQELGLLPGDVVTSVDGRKVTSPSQLMRILRTYDQGEEFKLQIMRQKRAETVSGKMP